MLALTWVVLGFFSTEAKLQNHLCHLPDFPLWKHVALVGKGQNLAGSRENDYKYWHMEEQIVPHSVHQVCAIFMD